MPEQTPNQYLKNLDVHFISLVDAGANKKTLVHKSAHHSRAAGPEDPGPATSFQKQVSISKTDEEKRLVYCIVYSPDEVDAHGDAMKAEEIEKAAHHFLFEGRTDQVDKQHDEEPDEGRVVESYIIGKNDANFPDDPAGSWAVVIKVLDDDTWEEVKKGDITGVSLQGMCTTEQPEQDAEKNLIKKVMGLFKKMLGEQQEVDKDFGGHLLKRTLNQATWALEDAIRDVMGDEDIDTFAEQKAAVLGVIDDFRSYVSDLQEGTSKQFKPTDMSEETKSKAEEPEQETTNGDDPSEIEKAMSKVLDEKLDPLEETVKDLSKRLEKVEEASPGSKVEKGQDTEDGEEKERKTKGLNILG